jgi:hypothetical protein
MHIIFGDSIKELSDGMIVLELDTFRQPGKDTVVTAYCVVEKLPLPEFTTLDAYKKIHEDLIRYYKAKEWNYCEQAIETLAGKWNGELDTFYQDLLHRVQTNKSMILPDDWDGSLIRI